MSAAKLFISYGHDSPEHKDRILALSGRLRHDGVDCSIDQYEQSPEEGWPRWCERQVEEATFVLVACTAIYLRRFKAQEVPLKGLGGTWEGHIITQEMYNAQGRNTKFIPITFSPEDAAFIPLPLQSATSYQLDDALRKALPARDRAAPYFQAGFGHRSAEACAPTAATPAEPGAQTGL